MRPLQQTPRRLLLFVVVLLLLAGCAVNPVTGRRELHLISQEQELAVGREQYVPARQLQGGDFRLDPELTAYVAGVGQRLARVSDRPTLPYEFTVVNDSSANAWALPGGMIAVNRGLLVLLEDEAELAAVLGHEIVHAAARHGAKAMERGLFLQLGALGLAALAPRGVNPDLVVGSATLAAQLVQQKYSREQELEADRYSLVYLSRAGYDPWAAVRLQETFLRLHQSGQAGTNWLAGLFASHPPSAERLAANRQLAARLGRKGETGRERYQRATARLRQLVPAYDAYEQGRKALADGDPEKAEAAARQALAMTDDEALFHGLLAQALAAQGHQREALGVFGEAIRRNPEYYRFYQERGLLELELGQTGAAGRDLAAATRLLPTATAHYGLGRIAEQQGDTDTALAHYRLAAAADDPFGRRARLRQERLELTRHPETYVRVRLEGDGGGPLLAVANAGHLVLTNLTLRVRITGDDGRILLDQWLTVAGPLSPGAVYRRRLAGLPHGAGSRLSYRVERLEPVLPAEWQ